MRHAEAISHREHLRTEHHPKSAATKIAQWTLYVAGAIAVLAGTAVWPGNVIALRGVHTLSGWLVILALWTLSVTTARAGVPRKTMWLAAGWGVATALVAIAQYQMRPGTWITALHVITGLGAIGFGESLLMRVRHGAAASDEITIGDAAAAFLANKRIAVTGVSRHASDHGSNIVYRRLRERGYEVFAINPNVTEIEGERSFPSLSAIPGGVDAVVIATRPERAMGTMRECADLGIKHVWMHRAMGKGSVSTEAAAWGRQRGIRVIAGGCPLMFDPVSDKGHKVMRSLFTLTGKVPHHVQP